MYINRYRWIYHLSMFNPLSYVWYPSLHIAFTKNQNLHKEKYIMAKVDMANPYQGKVSVPFIKVISVFLSSTDKEFSGYDILKTTSLQSGTVYPMLGKLLEDGWLKSEWKNNPQKGKPDRLCYTLTVGGKREALKILADTISPNIEKCFESSAAVI